MGFLRFPSELLDDLSHIQSRGDGRSRDLHDSVHLFFLDRGYASRKEFPVADKGNGRCGFIDLHVSLDGLNCLIELDNKTPRGTSLMKLSRFPHVSKMVILRGNAHALKASDLGLDYLVNACWNEPRWWNGQLG